VESKQSSDVIVETPTPGREGKMEGNFKPQKRRENVPISAIWCYLRLLPFSYSIKLLAFRKRQAVCGIAYCDQ